MNWGPPPTPNGRPISRIAAAVLLLLPVGTTLFVAPTSTRAQDAGPTSQDTIDWRRTVAGDGPPSPADHSTPTDPSPTPPSTGTDLGARLLQMVVVLAGVCVLAYAVLRWGVHGLMGAGHDPDGPLQVLARRSLGSKTAILVVRVGSRGLVLGDSDEGLTRLDTLDADELEEFRDHLDTDDDSTTEPSFSSLWRLGTPYADNAHDE